MRLPRGCTAIAMAAMAAIALASDAADASAVPGAEELNPVSFLQFTKSSEVVMVDFYAPWCGHCRRFAPNFDAAARKVAELQLDAKLGKVDCTIHQRFCAEKGITSYPTMKIYKQGEELYHEYTGPRRVSALVGFLEKQVLPVITHISSTNSLDAFLEKEKSEIVLVGYIDNDDEPSRKAFSAAAEKLHEDFPIGLVSNSEVAKYKGVAKTPAIVLYEPWEEGKAVFDETFEVEAIKTFAKAAYVPLVGELSGETFNVYTTNTPTGFFFVKSDEELKQWSAMLKPVAKTHKLRIAMASGDDFAGLVNFLAVRENTYPSFAIFDPRSKTKYALDEAGAYLTIDKIDRFMNDFVTGRLSPTIKSLPVPTRQDGPVVDVVATTFKEIVMDPSKDVLINFFREDCPFCKALAPTWGKLGELSKKQGLTDRFVVAAVDAGRNELEDKPMFVPTIKLYKAGDKSNPISYTGNRSIQDLIQFVKDHSTNGIDVNTATMQEEPVVNLQPPAHGQSPMHYGHDEL